MVDSKIYVAFLHNFNLQFAECPVDRTEVMVWQGYIPLLEVYEAHPQVKVDFFFTGYTDEYLLQKAPQVVERVKAGRARGQFGIGTYTYAHPILSLIPYEDVRRQIARGMECDEQTWGERFRGLLLPEVSWDVCLPRVMEELRLEWVAIYKEIVPAYAEAVTFPSTAWVEGIRDMKVQAILADRSVGYATYEVMEGQAPEVVLGKLRAIEGKAKSDQLVAIKTDAEALYFSSLAPEGQPGPKWGDKLPEVTAQPGFDRLLSLIEGLPYVQFTTLEGYLAKHPPIETLYAESISGHAGFDTWLRGEGRERLNVLETEARSQIHAAEYAITLATRQGAEVREARRLLEGAWDQLLLAENSDGRGFVPHPSRKIFVATAAVEAVELAKKAVEAIDYGK